MNNNIDDVIPDTKSVISDVQNAAENDNCNGRLVIRSSNDSVRARHLWRRLADVLRRHSVLANNETWNSGISSSKGARFETFDLIRWEPMKIPKGGIYDRSKSWWRTSLGNPRSTGISVDLPSLIISFVSPAVNIDDLIGPDNTGNVRVWASEEIMTYWCVWSLLESLEESGNTDLFICELAGGMTCLCGLFLASASASISKIRQKTLLKRMILTDGHEKCVDNVRLLIQRNSPALGHANIESRVLKFGQLDHYAEDLREKVDVVLAADCLFYAASHRALLATLDGMLKRGGRAFLFAPERNGTLRQFVSLILQTASHQFELRIIDLKDSDLFSNVRACFENSNAKTSILDFPKLLALRKL